MQIEFDPGKDEINRAKHGLSLAAAAGMTLDQAQVIPDLRRDYGELRFQVMGMIGERLHVLVFTRRGDVFRAISLRRANERERKRHGEA